MKINFKCFIATGGRDEIGLNGEEEIFAIETDDCDNDEDILQAKAMEKAESIALSYGRGASVWDDVIETATDEDEEKLQKWIAGE